MRELRDQVVVLTGASGGIGRATALQLATAGARLSLAARDQEALDRLCDEVRRLGGDAQAIATDVSDCDQVVRLATLTVQRFGRIDTWVNNAGITTYGTVEQTDVAEIRRVIEVDLLGEIYGMKAALPHLRHNGGTIINVSSALGKRAVPLQAAYCAAKHGVVAFGEALRLELRRAKIPVAVVDVLPSSINTPLYEQARSKTGRRPRPIPPVYEPRVVADAIVAVAQRPVREVYAGLAGRLFALAQRISPALLDRYLASPGSIVDLQQAGEPSSERDNVFTPATASPAHGRVDRTVKATSLYTRWFALHPNRSWMLGGLLVGLVALGCLTRRASA